MYTSHTIDLCRDTNTQRTQCEPRGTHGAHFPIVVMLQRPALSTFPCLTLISHSTHASRPVYLFLGFLIDFKTVFVWQVIIKQRVKTATIVYVQPPCLCFISYACEEQNIAISKKKWLH